MNKKPTKFKETSRHPSQNEMNEPVEIDYVYKNESKHMNKKLIRLTEQDLHKIVKESVQKMLVKDSENKTVKEARAQDAVAYNTTNRNAIFNNNRYTTNTTEDIGYTDADEPSNKPQIDTPWSEYDEVMFRTAKEIIWESDDASEGTTYKVIDWLKSIKNRVQSKQNG